MEMLSNDTYIQKTNKGSQALLVQPPISIKLRYYLHEIPMLEEIHDHSLLIKVSQLYTVIDSSDPIDFSRTLQDMLLKGWIEPVPIDFINKLFNDNKDEVLIENKESNVIGENPIAETLLNDNEKELSEWLMEEQLKKEKIQKEEELKKTKERESLLTYEQETIPEIPWDSPYNSLQDFLNDSKPPQKSFRTDAWENVKSNTIEDSQWNLDSPEEDSSSSYSRTQEARYREQLTLMKKEKKKKTGESSVSGTEKSETEKNKGKGFLGMVGTLFNKNKK